jgi:hypothetical protein
MKNIPQKYFFEYTGKYRSFGLDEKCFCVNSYS